MGQTMGNYVSCEKQSNELVFRSDIDSKIRITAYSDYVIRIAFVKNGEQFFTDDHYEMVANHEKKGVLNLTDKGDYFEIRTDKEDGIVINLRKNPMRLDFYEGKGMKLLLRSKEGIVWDKTNIDVNFEYDASEHFCGLGHQAFGFVSSLDLKGKATSCNYGDYDQSIGEYAMAQAFLIVPFYLSSKGYGIFLNSTFQNRFNFGKDSKYSFGIDTKGFAGRMDFFVILGPEFPLILDRYTQLTGRPRFPQKAIFGLALSDKDEPDNNGEEYWMTKIKSHRDAGFPIDHIVNDNRWRAGSGAWSGSWFEWSNERYPDPKRYAAWCKSNGVIVTLDLNRNNASSCQGWKPEFNIPNSSCVKEFWSVPDYSKQEVRDWVWNLFWTKSFNPALSFPGDALWIDETDELQCIPDTVTCGDGRSWAENKNYYLFLVAKAIGQQGWDNENHNMPPGIGDAKRPFIWTRGMTAGGQRYATYWTGDIKPTYEAMEKTIRGMLAAGLSGFPYFNHDAGGFLDPGPDDPMYIQWSMAFGSFTPIWRPHGVGINKRWPLDRSEVCREAAMKYSKLRYEMMPYIYTCAHEACVNGMPMARAMVVDYQNENKAWQYDLQYMWGSEILVAPVNSGKDTTISLWLPPGQKWYSFWNDTIYEGGIVLKYKSRIGVIPMFVKEGAIIPKNRYAKSTFWLDSAILLLDIYAGKNGSYTLYEDDGVTEKFNTKSKMRTTEIHYDDGHSIIIQAAKGSYNNAPENRTYEICIHGLAKKTIVQVNGQVLTFNKDKHNPSEEEKSVCWSEASKTLHIYTGLESVHSDVTITFHK